MDPPETTPIQPNVPPNIRRAPGLTLTPAEESLLARAFAGSREIFVEREFRSGYSGAVVLLVSPASGQAQVVVKLGSPVELQQEYATYRQFVKQALPQNTARLQGEPLLTADEQLALLSYTFAGGDPRSPTNSLQAYYERKGGQATAAVLDRIFRVYGRQWWANNRPQKFVVSEQYDRLLPVHLKLKPAETVETNPRTLVAGQINAASLRDLEPGQPVRLQGFHIVETRPDRQEVKLTANPPPGEASGPLRLRLETDKVIAYQLGERLETLDTVITATRQTILAEAASSAWPAFDPEATHLSLNGRTYSNPLLQPSDLLDQVIEARVSTIHGDLNLQNILVDEETGFAWLIDFAETRRGPTLFDLQRLESQVISKLLPPAIAQAGLEPATMAGLLESLHADPPSPTAPHAALQEPYTVLVTLRRLARQYLIDDRDWNEYYLGLVITLVGSLKYPELEPVGRQLALAGAAIAQEVMGKPVATAILTPTSSQPISIQGRGGVAVVESPAAQPSIGQQIANFFTGISEQQRDLRNRQIMLQRVHDFWVKGVLENSLHNEVLIELGMETKLEAVEYPWEMVIRRPDQPNRTLPLGTKMIDVFDESGGSLLILGEPGSGKTTMLLELARQLIKRAQDDPTQPIPVVFNLSSWGQRQLSLDEWLVEELNSKYNIPKKVGRPWLTNNELLLLLDGLDEVDQDYLLSCLDAINAFHKDSFASIVVSSRIAEYESLSRKIGFQQAIVLRELTSQQIEAYLAQLPYDFLALRKVFQKDLGLQELARTPLMLSIITLVYGSPDPDKLPLQGSPGIQRHRLFEEYVQQMFERRGTNKTYRKDRTLHWLAWLARNMKVHTQTVFLIENLQPAWLSNAFWQIT
jgi:hypothetical protein